MTIAVRCDVPRHLELLRAALPPDCSPFGGHVEDLRVRVRARGRSSTGFDGDERVASLYVNNKLVGRDVALDVLLRWFEQQTQLAVATWCPNRVFVHAGAVVWNGSAIVLPGPSFAGKTELVLALLRRGATLYSDEYAVLADAGDVEPFARPLALRSRSDGARTRVPACDIGARVGFGPIPIGLIALTRFEPGALWAPRRLSPAQLTVGLIQNAVAARIDPARVLDRLSRVARMVPGIATPRGDADATAPLLLEVLDDVDPHQRGGRTCRRELAGRTYS